MESQGKDEYLQILSSLKETIKNGRIRAAVSINRELLSLYWEIGSKIIKLQDEKGWGAKIIDTLSVDLKAEFPDFKGLSVRNLKYMKSFAHAYQSIVQSTTAQLESTDKQMDMFGQSGIAQISWTHHIAILDKVQDTLQRLFYIQETIINGWSVNLLKQNIDNALYARKGKALTNFSLTLPPVESDLAIETLKNPYVFDFLSISEMVKERDIEKALISHLKNFMLELGKGFAYVGNQYNINISNDDFFLDLLFYNVRLKCFVIFELKVGDFKPEYAGKLNFYINALDAEIKGKEDNPTIGVLLCKTPNETVVKYALQNLNTPIGVSEYQLQASLPKQLTVSMPSVDELESEIEKEYDELTTPLEKKKSSIKDLISKIRADEIKMGLTAKICLQVFDDVVISLQKHIAKNLQDEVIFFDKVIWRYKVNESHPDNANKAREKIQEKGIVGQLGLELDLKGFKKAGPDAFDVYARLDVVLAEYYFHIQDGSNIEHKGLYHVMLNETDLVSLAESFSNRIYDQILEKLRSIT